MSALSTGDDISDFFVHDCSRGEGAFITVGVAVDRLAHRPFYQSEHLLETMVEEHWEIVSAESRRVDVVREQDRIQLIGVDPVLILPPCSGICWVAAPPIRRLVVRTDRGFVNHAVRYRLLDAV